MTDKFRAHLESVVDDAAQKNFVQMISGQSGSGIMKTIEDAIARERVVPAIVIKRVDGVVTFVTASETLLNKTAGELRSKGLIVPNGVPDCAKVRRAKSRQLVFSWAPIQIIDVDNPSRP